MTPTIRRRIPTFLVLIGLLGLGSMGRGQAPSPAATLAAKKSEAEYLRARLARVEAEIALETYVGTTIPEQDAAAEAGVKRARAELDRAERMPERGGTDPDERQIARLTLEQAELNLEKAETARAILNRYVKEKTTKELRSVVEKAAALESTKQAAYDKARAQPSAQSPPPPAG
ncbi:hypothetical protein TA3x_005471 [Tundrisphaera sp. TA3]|uniref:hypothetical protein n=1 Tax=Tundrisphaera sp. TA3 TaxID=3435775 RepID=UPI003EB90A5D